MKIFDFRDELNNGQRKLSALVRYDANPERDIRVFICRPQEAGILDATGDPFLVAFLLPCMALHEDLFIDAAVSRQVYDRMQDYLQPLMLDWHPSF